MTPPSSDSLPDRVSIKDIAQAAGVSHSTVSRALNDSPLVKQATRARIKALATEMGYIPNAVARSLKAQRSGTVGLVVTSLTDPFFSAVMSGVDSVASEAGLGMFVTASHNDPDREMEVIETFHRRRVEGIIVAASRLGARYRQRLVRIQVPIVLINQHTDDTQPGFRGVALDEREGARLAVEHLLSLGHRRIGYLGLGNRQRSNRQRLAGYRDAMRKAQVASQGGWELQVAEAQGPVRSDTQAGRDHCPTLLAAGVSAIFCYNDRVGIGVLQSCEYANRRVPEEVSVVGFDDIDAAEWVRPELTTVRQPRHELGAISMEMMLELLAGLPTADRVLSPRLVVRHSTAPPA